MANNAPGSTDPNEPKTISIPSLSELASLHKQATKAGQHERAQLANSAVEALAKAHAAAAEAEVLARFMRAV